MKKTVTIEARFCDSCDQPGQLFIACTVCGGDTCPACRLHLAGCPGEPKLHLCRKCGRHDSPHRSAINALTRTAANEITAAFYRLHRDLARLTRAPTKGSTDGQGETTVPVVPIHFSDPVTPVDFAG